MMAQHNLSHEALEALQGAESGPARVLRPMLFPAAEPRRRRQAPRPATWSKPTKPTYRKRRARAKAKAARQARRANRRG
ncbi:hypothetical protein [Sediminicurvatus halobius]|uniref:Uncharacterized protein n=1 Tax=Sediminicurvatus halobius TaxID=2182432 RepID=A0A2U2N1A0_9GAMM|nr:hypothetical protein [Spiribacter halobius]PWG62842.1 hypothetical protein DEM34_10775 [Spiribacter halobius]UEX77008.1 hypothetical protein LMH63_13780 [Spiribacter halobius]